MSEKLKLSDILDYEIRSSWWASYIFWKWGQELSARYFAWKARRKYGRYLYWIEYKEQYENRLQKEREERRKRFVQQLQ